MWGKGPTPTHPEVRRSLGDQVLSWVEEHLDVELTTPQAQFVVNLYGTASTPEG